MSSEDALVRNLDIVLAEARCALQRAIETPGVFSASVLDAFREAIDSGEHDADELHRLWRDIGPLIDIVDELYASLRQAEASDDPDRLDRARNAYAMAVFNLYQIVAQVKGLAILLELRITVIRGDLTRRK